MGNILINECVYNIHPIYICYSLAGRSVLGETVPEILSTARGRRPYAASEDGKIICYFF